MEAGDSRSVRRRHVRAGGPTPASCRDRPRGADGAGRWQPGHHRHRDASGMTASRAVCDLGTHRRRCGCRGRLAASIASRAGRRGPDPDGPGCSCPLVAGASCPFHAGDSVLRGGVGRAPRRCLAACIGGDGRRFGGGGQSSSAAAGWAHRWTRSPGWRRTSSARSAPSSGRCWLGSTGSAFRRRPCSTRSAPSPWPRWRSPMRFLSHRHQQGRRAQCCLWLPSSASAGPSHRAVSKVSCVIRLREPPPLWAWPSWSQASPCRCSSCGEQMTAVVSGSIGLALAGLPALSSAFACTAGFALRHRLRKQANSPSTGLDRPSHRAAFGPLGARGAPNSRSSVSRSSRDDAGGPGSHHLRSESGRPAHDRRDEGSPVPIGPSPEVGRRLGGHGSVDDRGRHRRREGDSCGPIPLAAGATDCFRSPCCSCQASFSFSMHPPCSVSSRTCRGR